MKKIVAVPLFLVLLFAAYWVTDQVLSTKADDAIGPMEKYYALPRDTVDVLMVGSSHVGMNVDNGMLWDDYGIASYTLWSGMQPLWNTYYFLKEGLKYQNPKVVVAEVFLAGTDVEYSDKTVAFKNVRAMRPSVDRFKNALISYPTWQEAAEALWGMPYYHNRYDELEASDLDFALYTRDLGVNRIQLPSDRIAKVNLLDGSQLTDQLPLSEKNEKYLRMMIDLCKSKGVQLVLLIAPYEANETEAAKLNTLTAIAAEYGVPTLNYLKAWQDINIDPSCDFYDVGHLQYTGIVKLTDSIGTYLQEHYQLADRRLDAEHLWSNAEVYTAEQQTGYTMEMQFQGDGVSRMVDTGEQLYANRYDSWTLLTRIDMATTGDDGVYMSCFSESDGYYGLLMSKTRENTVTLLLGERYVVQMPEYQGDTATVCIVKDIDRYTVYWNGNMVLDRYQLPCEAYSGNLLVGCQELSANGEKFRFSRTHVLNLEVYDHALTSAQVCDWNPPDLPMMPLPLGQGVDEPEVIYTLPEQFIGGTELYPTYVDTGVRLFEDTSTCFTVMTELLPTEDSGDGVFLADFAEEPDHYRGLLVRLLTDGNLNIVLGNNLGVSAPVTMNQSARLAVVKNTSTYTVYLNGEKLVDCKEIPTDPYAGQLLVGAELTEHGNVFRQSKTRVNSLTVLAGCLSEEEILAWAYEKAAPAQVHQVEPTSVSYTMPAAYVGNGVDRYVDTGVQLFDMKKDWTLDTTVTLVRGSNKGVYLSCFAEQPDVGYRGLMLRQDDLDSVTLYLGGLQTWRYELPDDRTRMHLVVTKHGEEYIIAVNGEVQTSFVSPCIPYEGTLLVGCQQNEAGEMFRFGTAVIDRLLLEDGAITPEEAAQRSEVSEQNSRF
ncbi:MAG: hypothetical protein PUC00_02510 [Clostridiales bacterium]|nr:hypothetical protein [Clostridiales bacterium]